ncbi:MAG: hypothetical protein M5T61_00195 [Acidimicrobiia bacterium]|nr:hypothetical protein [Acidimicrobiia bacterium]
MSAPTHALGTVDLAGIRWAHDGVDARVGGTILGREDREAALGASLAPGGPARRVRATGLWPRTPIRTGSASSATWIA